MAIFSLHAKIIGKGQKKGGATSVRSAVASAAYRAGAVLHSIQEGVNYDYSKKQGIVHSEIMLPVDAPERLRDRQTLEEVLELMDYDELELDMMGDRKTALFVITSDTDKTFNFIAAIMYSQMFNLLCDKALYDFGGKLPIHLRCILDEFANIGKIPNFEELIPVIRSRNISASIIIQSKAQLESIYDKQADTIIDNCDTMLFLGGKSVKTLEEVSKLLGKQTISNINESKSRGTQKSDGNSTQKLARELLTLDELAAMERGRCICQIQGVRPFLSKKYDLRKHPRYGLSADADRSNEYIPPWVKLAEPPQPEESFIFYEYEPITA